jgi:uncharacterized protein (DUF362 family)
MNDNEKGFSESSRKKSICTRRTLLKLAIIALVSAIWLFIRTGRKPSRITYPCQQAAIANIQTFRLAFLAFIAASSRFEKLRRFAQPILVGILLTSSLFFALESSKLFVYSPTVSVGENVRVPLSLEPYEAMVSNTASNIFVVQNASGFEGNMDNAMTSLIELMDDQGIQFFQASNQSEGLIASNDIVLLKVNCQWSERGGTNTDLVKSLIATIVNHPDEFSGEIVIADNGQGVGSLNWSATNSFYHNQSMEDLVALFPSHKVSTKLWDDIREYTVGDYDEGDFRDGYVRSTEWNPDTELYVSYPKWQTPFGTYLSFKQGIWENETDFNSERLKVINLPVLKSHHSYGVTGCIKHYMGLPQGHIVSEISSWIPHEHFSIALGGMGTLMAETRFPVLNILDTIWINANPTESSRVYCGPSTYYRAASFTDIICASLDPVALDYYASKNILMLTAEYENHTEYSSLDPDYQPRASYNFVESFHNYLNRSMNELDKAGFQVTMNQEEMNVYINVLPSITPTPSDTPEQPFPLLNILVPMSAFILVVAVIIVLKRKSTTTAAKSLLFYE